MWQGLSLFSGISGLDLAFEWAGGKVSAMCEIEPFCRKVLHKHWPDMPLFEDVRKVRGADVGAVDIIYGGFPCQPFSVAGNKKGKYDSRYMWPEFSRLVGEIRPRWVLAENVPDILHIADDDVCTDLERQGYKYIGNEGISIIDNADKLGVPIPKFLRGRFLEFTKKISRRLKSRLLHEV